MPTLERFNKDAYWDFLKTMSLDLDLIAFYIKQLGDFHRTAYVLKNMLYEIPYVNKSLFQQDIAKVVPSLTVEQLSPAVGYGGVRPQLIDKNQRKLVMGEGKINPGNGIIFNITPSPGGTTCLGTAEVDMRQICERLGAKIDEGKLKKTLLEGEYPILG
eukprot:GHVN01013658.1.p2 GENE.GHVN01013658.1~~GHVN01013658.1.p2  ORF type:complete len:168 (-),score=26.17 GHVN01013658.1:336-812(-)